MRLTSLLTGALLVSVVVGVAEAQDVAPQLSGRLESSYSWFSEPLPDGESVLGLTTGWAGLTAGTKDVKSELRLAFASVPTPEVTLQRAWVKFRLPGVRVTTGWGRLAWGTGVVLVTGDLLFDSLATGGLNFAAEELRAGSTWLADAWWAAGDEAFVEAALVRDAAGVRVSAAPGGVTLEAASAWDRKSHRAKAAVSTQVHAGVDWYATVRQDVDTQSPAIRTKDSRLGGGAFGLWTLVEGVSLASRHEVVMTARHPGANLLVYDDATLVLDGVWSVTARVLGDSHTDTWSPSTEVRWGPLQNLSLALQAPLQAPWWLRTSATARW